LPNPVTEVSTALIICIIDISYINIKNHYNIKITYPTLCVTGVDPITGTDEEPGKGPCGGNIVEDPSIFDGYLQHNIIVDNI